VCARMTPDGDKGQQTPKIAPHDTRAGTGKVGPASLHVKALHRNQGKECTGARGTDRSRLEPGGRLGEGDPASPSDPSPMC
jgi:hypothetical protein